MRRLLAPLVVVLVGCGSTPDEVVSQDTSLTTGSKSNQPAVGSIGFGLSSCTGNLIGSRVMLTAAHCMGFSVDHSGLLDPRTSTTTPWFHTSADGVFRSDINDGTFQQAQFLRYAVLGTSVTGPSERDFTVEFTDALGVIIDGARTRASSPSPDPDSQE